MPTTTPDKVFIIVDNGWGPNSDGTETWLQLSARFSIMRSDGSLVDLSPIGTPQGAGVSTIRLEYGDSWQDIQRKIVDRILVDLEYMADNGGANLDSAHLHFEFVS